MGIREILESKLDDLDPVVRAHARRRLDAMDGSPPAYPSPARQVANFVGAVGRIVASGFAAVSEAEQARRLAICRAPCEMFDPSQDRCRGCGCPLAAKSRWLSEPCPLSKW